MVIAKTQKLTLATTTDKRIHIIIMYGQGRYARTASR